MDACNAYYYATRDPLGQRGDFVTAPEISQMFGELIGASLADCWTRAGSPANAIYAEVGPGRGTLAADALRVMRRAGFTGEVHLVETSPVLRAAQAELVPGATWHEAIAELPPAPMLLVANEFLDALPIRQFAGGVERRVMVAAGGLAFDRDGEIVEVSPARDEATEAMARHLAAHGGVALVIDYGFERSAAGETLQAMRSHQFTPVLADPGEQDLTSHV
jgi:SAM-dependent MidA family methyltransferase